MANTAGSVMVAPGDPLFQVITSTGTWTKPNGIRAARVRVQAPGGGSGGCNSAGTGQAVSGAGGGGGYSEDYILAANLLATETVTIGAVGAAGASGTNAGGTGGTTSFGAHMSCPGGGGGGGGTNTTTTARSGGGAAGAGSGGSLNIQGGAGDSGYVAAGFAMAPPGGVSMLGGPGRASGAAATVINGIAYGTGAPGVWTTTVNSAGGTGGAGVVVVESIF